MTAHAEVIDLVAKLKADEEAEALKKQHPNHLSLDARLVEDGRRLTAFSEELCALGFSLGADLSADEQDACLALAEYLRDYGDISDSFTSFGERVSYQTEIAGIVDGLKLRGISVYTAIRHTKLLNDSWTSKTPLPWTIGYLVFGAASGFGPVFNVTAINGNNGSVISGGGHANGLSAALADINGDGFSDIVLGGGGVTFLVFGGANGFTHQVG